MDELNRGELAEMFKISVAQLRYYEDHDLIEPAYIADNGYRKYGMGAIYRLSYILYMREFDMSIKEIKACLSQYSKEEIIQLIAKKKENIMSEILRLNELVENIDNSFQLLQMSSDDSFSIESMEETYFDTVKLLGDETELTVREHYDVFKGMVNLYKTDFAFIYNSSGYSYCLRTERKMPDSLVFSKGNYLTYRFTVTDNAGLNKAYVNFLNHCHENNIEIEEEIILEENSICSISNPGSMFYVLSARIK